MANPDLAFYWDPVCPFAWITSRWVQTVVDQRDYEVDWRFISLRILNRERDYATDFPPEYPALHEAGLRMLRVAAAVRADRGRPAMGPLYTAYGSSIWDRDPGAGSIRADVGSTGHISDVLEAVDLPTTFAAAADDHRWDDELTVETEEALSRTGRDVGTPIMTFDPPDGVSFFGPVISRIPSDEDALVLWDAVVTLGGFGGFAELKRSLREMPQLRALGATGDEPLPEEDWKGGRRA